MGWDTLLDIMAQAREDSNRARTEPPSACPNDGEPLEPGPGGVLHCRNDGWQYPRDWHPPIG